MDWIVAVLEQWGDEVRPAIGVGAHPALWVTRRASRISMCDIDDAFTTARGFSERTCGGDVDRVIRAAFPCNKETLATDRDLTAHTCPLALAALTFDLL
jgi:hypothetical protein